MSIVDFILARYGDIEQAARAASPGPWSPDADGNDVLAADGIPVAEGFALSGPQLRATVQHITFHDPAYVLDDIAAKRQIVDLHRECGTGLGHCDDGGHGIDFDDLPGGGCATLLFLAAPFADHPDFDPSWRPS